VTRNDNTWHLFSRNTFYCPRKRRFPLCLRICIWPFNLVTKMELTKMRQPLIIYSLFLQMLISIRKIKSSSWVFVEEILAVDLLLIDEKVDLFELFSILFNNVHGYPESHCDICKREQLGQRTYSIQVLRWFNWCIRGQKETSIFLISRKKRIERLWKSLRRKLNRGTTW